MLQKLKKSIGKIKIPTLPSSAAALEAEAEAKRLEEEAAKAEALAQAQAELEAQKAADALAKAEAEALAKFWIVNKLSCCFGAPEVKMVGAFVDGCAEGCGAGLTTEER